MTPNKLSTMTVKVGLRMILNHLMCLIVSLSVLIILPNIYGALIAQACNLGILLVMSYTYVWHIGDDDRNKFNYGHIKRDLNRGLKAGLMGYSPFLLTALGLLLCKGGVLPADFIKYYRMIMSPFMPFNQVIMPTTLTVAEQSWGAVILSALTALIVPIALWIAYRLGFNRISFTDTFFYSKKRGNDQ
ncbi:MAG: hypothetical protein PUB05_02235 [Firmicutes bacterium]|nr:hypothetical protein [Bacillota bacterium]